MRVSRIKYIYNLDLYHLSISVLLGGFNLWMINDTMKQRKEFEEYKLKWLQDKKDKPIW